LAQSKKQFFSAHSLIRFSILSWRIRAVFCCGKSQNQTVKGQVLDGTSPKGERVMVGELTLRNQAEIREMQDVLARNGWTRSLLDKAMRREGFLWLVREVLEGRATICYSGRLITGAVSAVERTVGHTIDCDAKPFEPNGFWVVAPEEQMPNRVRGQFVFDPTKVRLYLLPSPPDVATDVIMRETEFMKEFVLPANVLDFYLANPHVIPEKWKDTEVYFFGTIYGASNSDKRCVRYLYFARDNEWTSHHRWFDHNLYGKSSAAVRAS
jgi:hypothetical protein